ncbi:MAG: Gfo/Idh/MocA family oxidoreductase [Armatimonadetes bacterium]|nr:Gfo/Idh/MocA family oxidoreductase [Armatimonadota bacterium]
MGRVHVRTYEGIPGVRVAAIYSRNLSNALSLAEGLRCKGTDNADDLLDDPDIQVLDICLPSPLHKEFAVRGALKGKHIILEKPIALEEADGREILAACRSAGVQLLVGHIVRFLPVYRRVKRVLEEGEFGKPAIVRTTRVGRIPDSQETWYSDPRQTGGLLVDLLIHDFDCLCWWFGPVRTVFAREFPHSAHATLRFRNKVIAHVQGNWTHAASWAKWEICGPGGLLQYDGRTSSVLTVYEEGKMVQESPVTLSPFERELAHFLDCVNGKASPLVTGEEALYALRVALACRESSASRKPVEL